MNLKEEVWGAVLCTSLLSAVSGLCAEPTAPFYVANQNPFVQIYGLPKPESGFITPRGRLDAGIIYQVSNAAITRETANGETLVWDGETTHYVLRLRYGALSKLELGIDIPFIEQGGGYLDALIRRTHSILGVSNERQDYFDRNDIHLGLQENGTTLYELQQNRKGLGDLRLSAAIPLMEKHLHPKRHLAIRTQVKLPTGKPEYLLGSGGTDGSAGLALSDGQTLGGLNTVISTYVGMVYLGDAEIFESRQRHVVRYGGLMLGWKALDTLIVKLQLDVHSAIYETRLVQLGSSIQLVAGATWFFSETGSFDFGLSENVIEDATPDVGFYFLARHLF